MSENICCSRMLEMQVVSRNLQLSAPGKNYNQSAWEIATTVWGIATTVWEIVTTVWEIATTVWQIVTSVWEIATNVWEIATTFWEIVPPGKIVSVEEYATC